MLFEAFTVHEDLGWISNYSARFPRWPSLNIISRAFNNRVWSLRGYKRQHGQVPWWNRFVPRPQEGYPFWRVYCGDKFLWNYLIGVEADEEETERLRGILSRTIAWQGKPRFAAKLTGPPRMHYLRSIFPDAVFIHVVRDGRAVVHSLLNVKFWQQKGGNESEFWEGAFTDEMRETWERHDRSPVALAALQWVRELEVARDEQAEMPPQQFVEVRYEDYIQDPHATLRRLYTACGLGDSAATHRYIDAHDMLSDTNLKYRNMDAEDLELITSIMCDELHRYGFDD